MKPEKLAEKLGDYFERLALGKATKIEPSHVEKVIAKLHAKQDLLKAEREDAEKPSKKDRLNNKLATVGEQIKRADWLLAKIGS